MAAGWQSRPKGLKPLSWDARVLGKSGLGDLDVKALAWNVRDMGLSPICFQFFPARLDVCE